MMKPAATTGHRTETIAATAAKAATKPQYTSTMIALPPILPPTWMARKTQPNHTGRKAGDRAGKRRRMTTCYTLKN